LNEMIRDSAPTQARVAFDGVGKENAGAHQAHNCYNRLDHRKRSFVPEAKRHLRHEKGWSTLGDGPIVRVVHCLTRWYGSRDNRSAGITAVYVSATERARRSRTCAAPTRNSDDLLHGSGDDRLVAQSGKSDAWRGVSGELRRSGCSWSGYGTFETSYDVRYSVATGG
jgi:hypothetical protein